MPEVNVNQQDAAFPSNSEKRIVRLELPLVKVRKPHHCRLCGQTIKVGESVYSWSNIEPGEGWHTTHVHPECYAETKDWDSTDWECCCPGDMERPEDVTLIA